MNSVKMRQSLQTNSPRTREILSLQDKILELDTEVDHLRGQLLLREKKITEQNEEIRQLNYELEGNNGRDSITAQQEMGGLRKQHEKLQVQSIEEISKLEAQLKFKENEFVELSQEIVNLRHSKNQ